MSKNNKYEVELGSEKSFGFVFIAVFLAIGGFQLFHNDHNGAYYYFATAFVLFLITLVAPKVLRPFNVLWFKFGMLLHKIVSPLVMGFIFFFILTPIALVIRLIGKDVLRLSTEPVKESYWIKRDPPTPQTQNMKNQF